MLNICLLMVVMLLLVMLIVTIILNTKFMRICKLTCAQDRGTWQKAPSPASLG